MKRYLLTGLVACVGSSAALGETHVCTGACSYAGQTRTLSRTFVPELGLYRIEAVTSFALIGSNVGLPHETGPIAPPWNGGFQPFDNYTRWTMNTVNYAIDASFINAYGGAGVAALTNAIQTWDVAFGTNGTGTGATGSAVPLYDIETISAHEWGHAVGQHHPDEGHDSTRMGIRRNFDPSGATRVNSGDEVMDSSIGLGDTNRVLNFDDTDGINYLYDPMTSDPFTGSGVGDLTFTQSGNAVQGTMAGSNIDVFAVNRHPDFRGNTLAVTVFSYFVAADAQGNPFDGPGAFGGTAIGAEGIDIFFNLNQPIGVVPAPASLALLALGGLVATRRRR